MKKFDLIIIGGGAGAFAAAIKANDLEKNTLMVNDGLPLGGTCVNVGCVPSKTLLWAGEVMHTSKKHGIPGLEIEVKSFDFKKVIEDELNLVESMQKDKYEKVLASLDKVEFLKGRASFTSAKTIEVKGEVYEADKFVIATGSTARVPDAEGIREAGYLTHIEALKIKTLPKELVVMGGGPTALEYAQMYARFGSKVTILHHSERLFRAGEAALVSKLSEILKEEGLDIKLNIDVKKVRVENGKKILTCEQETKELEVSCDEILVAIGKIPNTKDLNLDKARVSIDKHQAIEVQPNYQTSAKHIFAVGDVVNLPLRLETTAGKEGSYATENALAGTDKSIDYNTVPYTIFTDPQMAGVGLTEEQQMKEFGACTCRSVSFDKVPKAMIIKRTEGMIKMAIDPKSTKIMGVHILAPNAGELIAEPMMLIRNGNTIDDVLDSLPMFPTLSEALKLVSMSFYKDISKLSCCI